MVVMSILLFIIGLGKLRNNHSSLSVSPIHTYMMNYSTVWHGSLDDVILIQYKLEIFKPI